MLKGYAEKWHKRMIEAYRVTTKYSLSLSAQDKSYFDQKVKGVVLKPEDKLLVRNLGERGGPGKLQSFWENKTYVVKEQISDNPVYVIYHRGRSKTLHRNLLLLSNDLPVQFPQQPTKPTSQPAKKTRQRLETNLRKEGWSTPGPIKTSTTKPVCTENDWWWKQKNVNHNSCVLLYKQQRNVTWMWL